MKKKIFIVLTLLLSLLFVSCVSNRYINTCATYEGRKSVGKFSNKKTITYNHKKNKK